MIKNNNKKKIFKDLSYEIEKSIKKIIYEDDYFNQPDGRFIIQRFKEYKDTEIIKIDLINIAGEIELDIGIEKQNKDIVIDGYICDINKKIHVVNKDGYKTYDFLKSVLYNITKQRAETIVKNHCSNCCFKGSKS